MRELWEEEKIWRNGGLWDRGLILMRPFIIKINQRIVATFCRCLLFCKLLIMNKINMSLEFDTVGTGRLVC